MILPKDRAITNCFKEVNGYTNVARADSTYMTLTSHERDLVKQLGHIPQDREKNKLRHELKFYN